MKSNRFGRLIRQVIGGFLVLFGALFTLGGIIAVIDEILSEKSPNGYMILGYIIYSLIGVGVLKLGVKLLEGKSKKATTKINQNINQFNESNLNNQSNYSNHSFTKTTTTTTTNKCFENQEEFFKEANKFFTGVEGDLNLEDFFQENSNYINSQKTSNKKEKKEIICSGCGAKSNVLEGTEVECEFCGSILKA